MEVTEEQLRERGFSRSFEEIEAEARNLIAREILAIPAGRRTAEPEKELSREEVAALERGGLDLSPLESGEPDPLAQTAVRYAAILATSYTTSEAARMLGRTEGRVRQRISDGTLYGLEAVGRGHRLPAFQFEGGEEIPHVGKVLKALGRDLHPVEIENWFTLPNPDLYLDREEERPVSPRQWLLSGSSPEALVPLAEEL